LNLRLVTSKAITPYELLGVFWKLENEVESLVSLNERVVKGTSGPWAAVVNAVQPDQALKDGLKAEVIDRATKSAKSVMRFFDILTTLGEKYLIDIKLNCRDWPVIDEILRTLIEDGSIPLFIDGALEFPGAGPLSVIALKLYRIAPAVMRPPPLALELPPQPQGSISNLRNPDLLHMTMSSERPDTEIWKTVLLQTVERGDRTLKFDKITIHPFALENLLLALPALDNEHKLKVSNIEFHECDLDDKCCDILEKKFKMPEWFGKIVLLKCKLGKDISQTDKLWVVS